MSKNAAVKQKVSHVTLSELRIALRRYEEEVYGAKLSSNTTLTYLTHARTFVRWLHGEFKPGAVGAKKDLTNGKKRTMISK